MKALLFFKSFNCDIMPSPLPSPTLNWKSKYQSYLVLYMDWPWIISCSNYVLRIYDATGIVQSVEEAKWTSTVSDQQLTQCLVHESFSMSVCWMSNNSTYCIPVTLLSALCVLFNSHANPIMYVDYCYIIIIVILLYYKRAKKTTE